MKRLEDIEKLVCPNCGETDLFIGNRIPARITAYFDGSGNICDFEEVEHSDLDGYCGEISCGSCHKTIEVDIKL